MNHEIQTNQIKLNELNEKYLHLINNIRLKKAFLNEKNDSYIEL